MRATPSGPGPSLEDQWETGAWRQQPGRGGLGGPPSSPDGVRAPPSSPRRCAGEEPAFSALRVKTQDMRLGASAPGPSSDFILQTSENGNGRENSPVDPTGPLPRPAWCPLPASHRNPRLHISSINIWLAFPEK